MIKRIWTPGKEYRGGGKVQKTKDLVTIDGLFKVVIHLKANGM